MSHTQKQAGPAVLDTFAENLDGIYLKLESQEREILRLKKEAVNLTAIQDVLVSKLAKREQELKEAEEWEDQVIEAILDACRVPENERKSSYEVEDLEELLSREF